MLHGSSLGGCATTTDMEAQLTAVAVVFCGGVHAAGVQQQLHSVWAG
jgi:hypothetical protein